MLPGVRYHVRTPTQRLHVRTFSPEDCGPYHSHKLTSMSTMDFFLFIDGTQGIIYVEEMDEWSKGRSQQLMRTSCLDKNMLSLWIY